METIFVQLVAIILFSTLFGLIARALKQPLILAYIVAGVVLGPSIIGLVSNEGPIIAFSQIGVAFLLFLVGLSMSTRVFREVGKVSLITGIGQVAFTTLVGYGISSFLGFSPIESIYIAVAFSFSSTIIIIKLLSDKKDLDTLYGKISIGFLLIQDFIAIGLLVILAGLSSGISMDTFVLETMIKLVALLAFPFIFNRFVLSYAFGKIAKNHELLFLSGIAWCFSMAYLSLTLGFSIEIGAFLAGVSLASIPYNYEISLKIKPLKDFFLILFFVVLGSQIALGTVMDMLVPAIVFSLFILIGNPLIVLILMGLMGYRKRTSFLSGLTVAQISEFSLILITLGVALGAIPPSILSLAVMVGIITIAGSSYMILHGEKLFTRMSSFLALLERKKLREKIEYSKKKTYDIVLVGHHEMGYHIRKRFDRKGKLMVVDFNPSIVRLLSKKKIPCLYGDVSDSEVVEKIKSFSPRLVISTIPTFDENRQLIREMKGRSLVFVTSGEADDAIELYKAGADYVFIPYLMGGKQVSSILKDFFRRDFSDIAKVKAEQIKDIQEHLRWRKTSNKKRRIH